MTASLLIDMPLEILSALEAAEKQVSGEASPAALVEGFGVQYTERLAWSTPTRTPVALARDPGFGAFFSSLLTGC
jgi:hypothetical protein